MACLMVSSCHNIFSPPEGIVGDGNTLYKTSLDKPRDVLFNFQYAYSYQDSFIYSTLIDSDFVFLYYEPRDEGGSGHYASWGREIELKSTGGLLRAFDHISLTWNSSLDSNFYYRENGIKLRQQKTMFDSCNFADLQKGFQLNLGENIYLVGNARFEFRKSSLDDQWRIYSWRDESF